MLDEREKLFMEYWEARRQKEGALMYQLLRGLPMGLLFSLPIVLLLFSSRYWYKRADMAANAEMSVSVLSIAILAIAVFVAVIYRRRQWEMREQQYLELKAREEKKS